MASVFIADDPMKSRIRDQSRQWRRMKCRPTLPKFSAKDKKRLDGGLARRVWKRASRHAHESPASAGADRNMPVILLKLRGKGLIMGEVPMILRYDHKATASKMNVGATVLDTLRLILRRRLGIGTLKKAQDGPKTMSPTRARAETDATRCRSHVTDVSGTRQ